MSGNTVYLVDGSGYIFRAFFAITRLTNRAGFPTNALYGFTRMLLKLLAEANSDHVVAVFDAGRATFRTELYPEYKANREECPDDLRKQMPYFRELTRALGLPTLELPGFEADDIIGTLAKRLSGAGHDVVIVGADKDLMQLIDDHVSMWDTMRDRRMKHAEVVEKFGVGPEKVCEVLALMGDTSDNIPGLNGVGPKTATQLILKYESVEGVIAAAEKIKEDKDIRGRAKIAATIESDTELLRLSRRLVEIDLACPVKLPRGGNDVPVSSLSDADILHVMERCAPDEAKLAALVEEFEFSSLVKEFHFTPRSEREVVATPEHRYHTVWRADFPAWVERFKAVRAFALDIESTSLNVQAATVVGVSFCWADDEAYYIPLAHRETPAPQVTWAEFVAACGAHLGDPAVKKYGQNIKYDASVLARCGVVVEGIEFDTMIASYVLNPDRNTHNLTALCLEFLRRPLIEYEDIVGDHPDFSYVDPVAATAYGGQDAHVVWLLKPHLEKHLREKELTEVFRSIEMPLVPVLARMELAGVKLDTALLSDMSTEFGAEIARLEKEIFALAGIEFNLNSPKQLADVLFNRLGISTQGVKKTKTGISTDSSVLEKLSEVHPLPGAILHYRMIHKLKSTYVDALPAQVAPTDGRLHSRFNQTGTGTGRLSSSDPNLQNIPVQTKEGQRIRAAFIAEPGYVLVSADYSQIELRLLAHMSGDANLIAAFTDGIDIHAKTAREVLGLGVDEDVTTEQRRIGKTINFGIVYGMSGFRLGRELGIPVGEATRYIESYFAKYPRVSEFFERVEREATERGYVTTYFGRKRFLADIDAEGRDKGFLMRAALNAPLQGTAADLIKIAMVRLDEWIRATGAPAKLILQIHDELVFECRADFVATAQETIRAMMERAAELAVPLKVDVGHGVTWQEAQG
jgi:DNA polymerase-1